jgi:hypothetical protein
MLGEGQGCFFASGRRRLHLSLDSLRRANTDATESRRLEDASAFLQLCADALGPAPIDPGAADGLAAPRALLSGPGKPGVYPLLDDRALELGEDAKHLEESPPGRRGCVHGLLLEVKIGPSGAEFAEKADKVLQRSAEPVYRPRGDHIDLTANHRL